MMNTRDSQVVLAPLPLRNKRGWSHLSPDINGVGAKSKRRKISENDNVNNRKTMEATKPKEENAVKTEPAKELSKDGQEDVSKVEKMRLKNLEENAKFLSSLGIDKVVESLRPKSKLKKEGRRFTKEKKPLQIRKSLRLQNMPVSESKIAPDNLKEFYSEPERVLRLSGSLSFEEHMKTDMSKEEAAALISELGCLTRKYTEPSNIKKTKKSIQGDFKKMKLNVDSVAKVTPARVCSLVVHPTSEKVIACAGDKYGNIGLFDVGKGSEGSVCYAPHVGNVYHLLFHPQHPSRLLSASRDGSLRCADLETAVFDEVYTTSEDNEISLMFFDMVCPNSIAVSQSDGCIAMVDTRTKSVASVHQVHEKTVKSVSVHPVQTQYILTGSNDSVVSLWDLRKLSKKRPSSVVSLPSFRSVDSAYFSPLTGSRILTTSLDDKLRIYDSSNLTDVCQKVSVRHNNNTGRWLSNFRATWHPQCDDLFVIGSMEHPRQIEVFDESASIVKIFRDENLASVCSLNVFHPTRNVVIGANSSGRLHVFMD